MSIQDVVQKADEMTEPIIQSNYEEGYFQNAGRLNEVHNLISLLKIQSSNLGIDIGDYIKAYYSGVESQLQEAKEDKEKNFIILVNSQEFLPVLSYWILEKLAEKANWSIEPNLKGASSINKTLVRSYANFLLAGADLMREIYNIGTPKGKKVESIGSKFKNKVGLSLAVNDLWWPEESHYTKELIEKAGLETKSVLKYLYDNSVNFCVKYAELYGYKV